MKEEVNLQLRQLQEVGERSLSHAHDYQEGPEWYQGDERSEQSVCACWGQEKCRMLEKSWTSFTIVFQVSDYWALITCLEWLLCFLSSKNFNKPWEAQIGQYKRIVFHGKIKKRNIIKLETLFTAKETINKAKRQHSEWEKIFSNEATDKGLISKVCIHLMQLNIKKNNPIKKWAEDLHIYFSKEAIQMVKKYMKRHSTSPFTGEIQIKTTMRYQLTLVRTAIIKNSMSSKCWRGCGEKICHLRCW